MRDFDYGIAQTAPPQAYGAGYYLGADGQALSTFRYDPTRTLGRVEAISDAAGLQAGARVLDFGCGLGAMTAAFNALGFRAVGVDPSRHAIENALPQAHGLVRHLGRGGLADVPNDTFDLVLAKDVFEHIDEDRLHYVVEELMCIGRQVLAIIPLVGKNRKFIFDLYERDETHITRFTRNEWLGFFPYQTAADLEELTPRIRRADKVDGTLCLLLSDDDDGWRGVITRERTRIHAARWPRLFERLWRGCAIDSANIL